MQGSDSDVSIASDYRSSKGNLKGRLSDMFKRSSSSTRESNDRIAASEANMKPVSVTTLNVSNGKTEQTPPPTTPRVRRAVNVNLKNHLKHPFNILFSSIFRVLDHRHPLVLEPLHHFHGKLLNLLQNKYITQIIYVKYNFKINRSL